MHLVYKLLVSCLPEPHMYKLLCLVRMCFKNQYHLNINDLRLFDYAIVAQKEGQFVGVLFVNKRTMHHDLTNPDSDCTDSIFLDSFHHATPETVHEIQYLCVLERFRNNNIASELLDCCKKELSENTEVGVNSNLGVKLLLQNNSHSGDCVVSRQRLVGFFERHDFKVQRETKDEIHMITSLSTHGL
jgi:hypothetical protein